MLLNLRSRQGAFFDTSLSLDKCCVYSVSCCEESSYIINHVRCAAVDRVSRRKCDFATSRIKLSEMEIVFFRLLFVGREDSLRPSHHIGLDWIRYFQCKSDIS